MAGEIYDEVAPFGAQEYTKVLKRLLEDAFPGVPIYVGGLTSAEAFSVLRHERKYLYGEFLLTLDELVTVKRTLYDEAFSALLLFPTREGTP